MPPIRILWLAMLGALTLAWSAACPAQNTAPSKSANESFASLVQSANAARDSGNTTEAIRDYSRAVALRPDWAEGWWDLGALQYEANQYAGAVSALRKLVALAPDSAVGWSLLGLSEFETQNYSGALASLQKARDLGGVSDPDIARVSAYHLALLYIRSGQFEKAASLLKIGETAAPQIKIAYALGVLRIPLLPSEVDPSQDALLHAVGDAWSSASPNAIPDLLRQYPKTPWLHYAYGLTLESQGRLQDALEQQKTETVLSPANPLPWIEMSRLDLRLGHKHQALAAARRAVLLDANLPASHSALAKALAANGVSRQAAAESNAAASLPPPAPVRSPRMIALYGARGRPATIPEGAAQWQAAMQDYSEGRYPQTIAALKVWVEQNPSDGTAWAVMGLSEFALKDYGNARIHLQRGINLGVKGSPQSIALARDRLALLLIHNGQFDAASSLLKPIAGQPAMADQIQLALGLALLRMPIPPDDLTPEQRGLAQSTGAIVQLLFASRYAQAFAAFQKLIAQHPTTPWLHYAYGDALESLSQYNDAKAQMRAEMKLSPHSPLPWIRIAAISLRQHLPAEALDAAQTAVRMAPDSAEAHYQLGRAWLENGDAQKAIAELQKASTLRPNSLDIHFVLARAYSKAGLPEKAAAERATFLQLKALAAGTSHQSTSGESILQSNLEAPQN
ncbi:MAG TPA: tetratricopeptide repeat protein [Acidobacteriaceae bacterium]|nr:tetratricopeptide repeat protein [Acidobacteriaceae bacterium]